MSSDKHQIGVITGTRAEYGLLRNLIFKLKENKSIDFKLIVTGAHLCEEFGNTQSEIIKDGINNYIKVPIPIDDDSKDGMSLSAGIAMSNFAKLFSKYKPDLLIVLGDRYEIFSAVYAAHLAGIRVAHIGGGDITEGAVDDAIRHCITKMSNLHFPGCEQSRKRIIQMGEQPQYVFNVGEPGVENCLDLEKMSRKVLAESLNFDIVNNDYSLVTFHPVTMENNTGIEQVYELIHAMDKLKDMYFIITMANADAGGRAINDIWIKEGKKRKNWLVVTSLGVVRYLSAMKYAKLVIGNSSSGIIETPSMGIPTINIGDRQKGRMMAESIISCLPIEKDISNSMNIALADDFQEASKHVYSPFGNGNTTDQIIRYVLDYLNSKQENNEKHFYNIDFSY